ncbi:MAG: hypothetical protein J5758_02800 [Abditibacteriota bacterium]|nr:hypothetical protein [Abditibacteriota bacterium]
MKKIFLFIVLLAAAGCLTAAETVTYDRERGIVVRDSAESFKVSLWDDAKKENEGFVASAYSVDGEAVISWEKIVPGETLRLRVISTGRSHPDRLISPPVPVSVRLLHTGWINGSRSVSSEYTAEAAFGGEMFGGRPEDYEPALARLGIMLCGAGYLRGGKPDTEALGGLLESMGFANVEKYNYYGSEQTERSDRAGIYLAHRKIYDGSKERELLLCMVRGTVGGEWFSNFDVGDTGAHKGFTAAAADGAAIVKSYLSEHPLPGDSVIMLTGHSRGAAVAQIMSLGIDKLGFEKVFCYVYACPNYTRHPMKDKSGRFSFMYEGDLVPGIPMWDFGVDGSVIDSGSFSPDEKARLKEVFSQTAGGIKCVAFSAAEKNKIINELTALAPNPVAFYQIVYKKSGIIKKVTPMTTYEFCVAMGKAMVEGNLKSAIRVPKDFDGIIWAFITDGAASPKIIQSHSVEMYLSMTEVYNSRFSAAEKTDGP